MQQALLRKFLRDEIFQLGLLLTCLGAGFLGKQALSRTDLMGYLTATQNAPSAPAPAPAPTSTPAPAISPAAEAVPTPTSEVEKNGNVFSFENQKKEGGLAKPSLPLIGDSPNPVVANKLKPLTPGKWVVDQKHGVGSDAASIGEAVQNAEPGDVIEVRAGTYREALTVGTDLTIRGPTPPNAVTLEASGPYAITVTGGTVKVENLAVVQAQASVDFSKIFGGIAATAGKLSMKNVSVKAPNNTAIWIDSGDVVLDEVTFSGSRGLEQQGGTLICDRCESNANGEIAVYVGIDRQMGQDHFPKATFRKFRGKDNPVVGIFLSKKAEVRIEDSEISGTGTCAMKADSSAKAVIVRTKINDNLQSGICTLNEAFVSIEDGEVNRNGKNGFVLQNKSVVSVARSKIIDNNGFAYTYEGESRLQHANSQISGNRYGEASEMGNRAPTSDGSPQFALPPGYENKRSGSQ